MAKTALEKLNATTVPEIITKMPERIAHWAPPGGTMVISTPREIDDVVCKIKKGKLATINTLRAAIAQRHGTDITCPVTTGIFFNIVAKAAAEREMMGAKRVSPWWRVLKSDGTLNEKMPGGVAEHRKRLEAEGFQIVRKGKSKFAVADFEAKLATL